MTTYADAIASIQKRSAELTVLLNEDRCKDCGQSYEAVPCGYAHMELQGHKWAREGTVETRLVDLA